MTLLFAVATGVAVGNLYWAQPLLDFIAHDLNVSTTSAGWLVTATQVGYAVGIVLIVPVGDKVDRRKLVPAMMLCAAVALTACALAPSFRFLLAAIALLGVTTVAGQILVPLAGDLADGQDRGRVVGCVVSGLLTGILVSRTISGLVAEAAGWRAIYSLAAVLVRSRSRRCCTGGSRTSSPARRLPYGALIRLVGAVVTQERAVRWTLALGALALACFTLFWTSLTLPA